jgi:hypothetical protein
LAKPDVIAYCEIREEHPDNERFLQDCESWFGQKVLRLGNDEYHRSAREVWRRTRFLVGPKGARCTTELKKKVRRRFQEPGDITVMGYTADETGRVERFQKQNAEGYNLWPILVERNLTRSDCKAIVDRAGIKLPVMYSLGYRNNNCIGCVKGQAGYWNKIRDDFPEDFAETAQIEAELGRTICKREWTDKDGKRQLERVPLAGLPRSLGNYPNETSIECSLFCEMAEQDLEGAS